MKIRLVVNLMKEQFISKYLFPGRPVIVTDAMKDLDVQKFNPEYLKSKFGDHDVQVYGDLFDLKTIESLATYLEKKLPRVKLACNN